jgi:hypothetical protein
MPTLQWERQGVWEGGAGQSAEERLAAEEEESARRAAADAHVVGQVGYGEDGLAEEDIGANVIGAALEDGRKLHVDVLQLQNLRGANRHRTRPTPLPGGSTHQ